MPLLLLFDKAFSIYSKSTVLNGVNNLVTFYYFNLETNRIPLLISKKSGSQMILNEQKKMPKTKHVFIYFMISLFFKNKKISRRVLIHYQSSQSWLQWERSRSNYKGSKQSLFKPCVRVSNADH